MTTKHQHADVIHAWADGAEIEFRPKADKHSYGSTYDWYPCRNPEWHENFEYRVVAPVDTNLHMEVARVDTNLHMEVARVDTNLHMEVARLNVLAKMHEDGD